MKTLTHNNKIKAVCLDGENWVIIGDYHYSMLEWWMCNGGIIRTYYSFKLIIVPLLVLITTLIVCLLKSNFS